MKNTDKVVYKKFDFYDDITYKNYTHVDGLINGVDIIGQIHNISVINENGNQWLVIADVASKKEGFGYIFNRIKGWFIDWTWFFIKWVLIALLCIGLFGILTKLLVVLVKYLLNKRNNNHTSVAYEKAIDDSDAKVTINPILPNMKMWH